MKQKFGFPKGFFWGSATASYQVEGGIENNDWAFEARSGKTPPNGVATDHYNRYEEDFDIVQSLSQNSHRFSIEWARIEPKPGVFNEEAIEHYRKVLESLKRRNITPFVTLWHFTLPLWLYKEGGFEHPDSPYFFARYSEYVVKKLGHLATYWITINEPTVYLGKGYVSRRWPPFKRNFWLYFWVRRRLISSHRLAYKRMKEAYPDIQIGIASNNMNIKSNLNPINKVIAIFFDRFWNHTFLNAIARYQDFIGLNYYLHKKFGERDETYEKSDIGWNIYPQGIYHVLMGLKKYKKMVYITENGIADAKDTKRALFIQTHLYWVHRAMAMGIPVMGYFYWSLSDNYEWMRGYSQRFGLIEINYSSLRRSIRPSAYEYKKICESNTLEVDLKNV